ncbi:MAG: alpha-L-fucosidase, partial [Victivallales bacterium]|nr:alpha-L-fucosidase [Victivallales bacterium]
MHKPKYCLFYDNHTMKACPEVGDNFDVEKFTDRIRACGVDYVTFHARCNQGFAYYDTSIGIKHPSLKYDLFGRFAEACQRKAIALTAYINGGLSNEEGILHRDWLKIAFNGRIYREEKLTAYVRTMCYNSPYRDHLIAMAKEVAQKYPVSGFFIDCLAPHSCVCPICITAMKKSGIDWRNEKEVIKFSEFSAIRLSRDIANALRKINPEFLLYFNNPPFEALADIANYYECECLPTGHWGYDYLPNMSHYIRTIRPEFPILNMTGRFNDWGDFGNLRTEAGLAYDLLYGLANGMRPNIGDHFHPSGKINHAVFDKIEKIYKMLQAREPWYDGAKNLTDIAIVFPKHIDDIIGDASICGASRMLSELKCQYNIVSECSDWSQYAVLVIPDSVVFNAETAHRVKAHISAGKTVIASGDSGLNPEKTGFALKEAWAAQYLGPSKLNPAFFERPESFSENLPDMPMAIYAAGNEVVPLPGATITSRVIKAYYNYHWDGEYSYMYNPPEKTLDTPFLIVKDEIAYFSFRIFEGYYNQAPWHLRELFKNVLKKFLPRPILRTEGLPSFSRVFVTEQPGRRIVHLLAYIPELRGKTQVIDEPITITGAKLS